MYMSITELSARHSLQNRIISKNTTDPFINFLLQLKCQSLPSIQKPTCSPIFPQISCTPPSPPAQTLKTPQKSPSARVLSSFDWVEDMGLRHSVALATPFLQMQSRRPNSLSLMILKRVQRFSSFGFRSMFLKFKDEMEKNG